MAVITDTLSYCKLSVCPPPPHLPPLTVRLGLPCQQLHLVKVKVFTFSSKHNDVVRYTVSAVLQLLKSTVYSGNGL
jgi:hypothetical protein